MGLLDNLKSILARIVRREDQGPPPPPPDDYTQEEVEVINQPAPPTTPQEEEITPIGTSDCGIEYISNPNNKRITPKWRTGCAGCASVTAYCVRDLVNSVPSFDSYTVIVHGEQYTLYPNKETATYWLSYKFSASLLYNAMNDDEYVSAADVINSMLGEDEQWMDIDEVSILNRIPDEY